MTTSGGGSSNGRRSPHLDALYSSAISMTRDPSSADDLIQETYFKAWRFWDKFKSGTSCKAWLFRIMMNTYINQYRRWSREAVQGRFRRDRGALGVEDHDRAAGRRSPHADDGSREALENLFSDEVKAAVEALPPYYRVVAILSDIEGFTYQEVAEILDIPHRHGQIAAFARARDAAGKAHGLRTRARPAPRATGSPSHPD